MEPFKDLKAAPQLLVTAVPTVDFSILAQPVKNEPHSSILNISRIKREHCASPVSQNEVLTSVKSENSTPVASPLNPNSVKNEDSSCSATISPALTTELENFQDLTEWCRRAPKTPNMSFSAETDELNTPVPELGDFWFTSPAMIDNTNDDYGLLNVLCLNGSPELYNGADIQSNKLNDLDSQIFGKDSTDNFNNLKSETYQYSNVLIGGGAEENAKAKNVTFTNNNVYPNTVNSSLNKQTSVPYQKSNTEMQTSSSTGLHSLENTENILTFAPSNSPYELPTETPMNFQEFVSFPLENVLPARVEKKILPRLDFSNIWVESKQVISTPEVISTALSLETGFNLVNFITEGNVEAEVVSPTSIAIPEEEDSQSRCPSTSVDPDPAYTPSESSEDDDEEYEPPWKKQKTPSRLPTKGKRPKKVPAQRMDLDSEASNASTIESVKIVRRGRPPKRNVSISSDSNADPEVSRYRELRDKNNEASRRSRLNRKMKEKELENEATDLDVRNRKLKVRVQELERLVDNMRSNLMQMLLRK